jgi:L-ascorbate metabolism protein UlaG (beta-lactamase superfamily)
VFENDVTVYLGAPAGFVVAMENQQSFYFAGDTALFGDMQLIREMYQPDIAFLPIGDHYTMGPEAAARACALLGVRQVVPMHYGTFPVLTGTPDRLKTLVERHGVDVLVLKPGERAE